MIDYFLRYGNRFYLVFYLVLSGSASEAETGSAGGHPSRKQLIKCRQTWCMFICALRAVQNDRVSRNAHPIAGACQAS